VRSPAVDPDEARRAARDILAGSEYSEPAENLVERAVGWIGDRLGDVVATLTGGGPGGVVGWLVVVGLVAGAAWLMVRALRAVRPASSQPSDRLRSGTEPRRDPRRWLEAAELWSASGDHRRAVRARYQGLLARMIVRRVATERPGRTSGEYRELLAEAIDVETSVLEEVTRVFEESWYGGVTVDGATYERFTRCCEQIEAAPVRTAVGA
jgi:hypothetical protein